MNLLNGPMDHGWCLGYTCQERISTFYGIVASDRNYSVYFTNTNPQKIRLHLLADKEKVIRFAIFYKTSQRLDIYRKGIAIKIFISAHYVDIRNAVIKDIKYLLTLRLFAPNCLLDIRIS